MDTYEGQIKYHPYLERAFTWYLKHKFNVQVTVYRDPKFGGCVVCWRGRTGGKHTYELKLKPGTNFQPEQKSLEGLFVMIEMTT